jgi:folate-binding protein YgfZ
MPIPTPLQERHEKAGAKLAEYFGCVLPERFGEFAEEYRWAREAVALTDKNYRAWFSFTGPDRARYLNAILTNDVRDLAPGRAVPSLLLNPQGHILAEVETLALAESVLGVSYALIREKLAATFERYIIMDDVTMEDASERMGALGMEGPKTAAALEELCGVELDSLPELGHTETKVNGIPCRVQRRSPGGAAGAEFIVERNMLGGLWDRLEAAARKHAGGPIGYATLSALRLQAGIPWFSYDFDETVIPQEAGLEETHISFTKGCYVGQEIVERVRSRGHVNRRRVLLEFTGAKAPERGAKLFAEGKEVGHVTRVAYSPAHGRNLGMGYLRQGHNEAGSEVDWEGGKARVIEIAAGKTSASAAEAKS